MVQREVETATVAAEPSRVASLLSAASRSVRQMLRPSTTPATSVLLASSGTAATAVLPPYTRSTPIASTGVRASAAREAPGSPK